MTDEKALNAFLQAINKLPKPPYYRGWLRVFDQMTVHSHGRILRKLRSRRPNEPDEIYQYRLHIYEPITKGSFNDSLDNCSRIFQAAQYKFNGSKKLIAYLRDTKFEKLSFGSYCEQNFLPFCIDDPNGVITWLPGKNEETGELEIRPVTFNSVLIRYMAEDAVLINWDEMFWEKFLEMDDTTKGVIDMTAETFYRKTFNDKGDTYLLITKGGWYKVKVTNAKDGANKETVTYEILYDNVDFDSLPIIIAGGNMVKGKYYDSFFNAFVPFGNEALSEYSDHQAVNIRFSYPVTEEKRLTCDFQSCAGSGYLDDLKEVKCPQCKGEGTYVVRSPYGTYFRTPSNLTADVDTRAAVEFHSPDVAILDYSSKEWQVKLEKAEKALHLQWIDEAQSGEAKKIDKTGQDSMIIKIANNYYDNLIFNSLWILENIINPGTPLQPTIFKPVDFSIRNADDVISEISEITSRPSMPKFIVSLKIEEYLGKVYDESNPIHKMLAVLLSYDPLYIMSIDEKQSIVASGEIDKVTFLKSVYAFAVLKTIVDTDPESFSTATIETIVTQLDTEIMKRIEASQPKTEPVLKIQS